MQGKDNSGEPQAERQGYEKFVKCESGCAAAVNVIVSESNESCQEAHDDHKCHDHQPYSQEDL